MNRLKSLIRLIITDRKAKYITIGTAAAILLVSCIAGTLIIIGGKANISASSPDSESDIGNDFVYITPISDAPTSVTPTKLPEPEVDEEVTSFVPADEMDLDPDSITVFVNKEYCLPKDYKPDDLVTPNIRFNILTYDERTMLRSEAAKAMERLFAAAENEGLTLYGVSGYRSFARQWRIFTNNIATQGKEHTLQYSAVPGTSEHQTGLSMDVSTKGLNYKLDEVFAETPEGKWLAENSYKYGFVIRYPKDKADITGYAYEPWHIRYVGRGLSYYLYNNDLTLDEYYHYTPDPDFDFEALYADIINYVPPSLTPSITPTVTPTVEAEDPDGPTTQPGDEDNPDNEDNGDDVDNPDVTPSDTPVPTPTVTPTVTDAPPDDSTDTDNTGEDSTTDDSGTTAGALDILIE